MSTEEKAEGLGDTEHDQDMAEKSEQTIEEAMAPAEEQAERPEWLPEKYDSVDAFLEGHKNLEKKLGERDEVEPADESESTEEVGEHEEVEAGPLDKFHQEFSENGDLSDESYKELEDIGYPRDVVDTYINGFKAQAVDILTEAHDIVGGEEEYNAMAEWAVDTLTDAQLDSYNDQLNGDEQQWELAIRGLHDKYAQSGDAPVERVRSSEKTPPNIGVQPFTSQEELTIATRDKRYSTSPEYRKSVEARLAISDDATMGANIPNPYAQQG